jgi:HEAT repeat protein
MTTEHEQPDFIIADDMSVIDEDDAADLDDITDLDAVSKARARLSVDDLLGKLVRKADTITTSDLFVLSDLSLAEMERVQARWYDIPVVQRRGLVKHLTASVNDYLELHLGRLLRIAVHDSDAQVRRLAIEGLWEDTGTDLIGVYVQILNQDGDSAVRAAAAEALGSYVLAGELDELDAALAMRAEQALLAIVHNQAEPLTVQCKALESIAYSGETGLHQLIEDAYYSPHSEMQISAVRTMGRSADVRWRKFAQSELSNPSPEMRAEAAKACGELEAKSATQELISLLNDDDHEVRLAAIEALGHLGGKAARDALRAIASGDDPDDAAKAEDALDEILVYEEAGSIALFDEDDEEQDDQSDDDPWERE